MLIAAEIPTENIPRLDMAETILEDPKKSDPGPPSTVNHKLENALNRFDLTAQDIIQAAFNGQKGCAYIARQVLRGKFCFDHASRRPYKFAGHYWTPDSTGEVFQALDAVQDLFKKVESDLRGAVVILGEQIKTADQAQKEALETKIQTLEKQQKTLRGITHNLNGLHYRKQVAEFAALGPDSLGITGDEWDRDSWLLPCKNGVIDLETGELKPGRPEQYLKSACPTAYNPDAKCPQFKRALMQICGGDPKFASYLQGVWAVMEQKTGLRVPARLVRSCTLRIY